MYPIDDKVMEVNDPPDYLKVAFLNSIKDGHLLWTLDRSVISKLNRAFIIEACKQKQNGQSSNRKTKQSNL